MTKERITAYERTAQFGGGAQRSSRNASRWNTGGLYSTVGNLAIERRPPPPDKPEISVGSRIANGLIWIVKAMRIWREGVYLWLYDFWSGNIRYTQKTLEEVVAHWAAYFLKKEVVGKVASRVPTTSAKRLPAPRIHGLLPANV
jgi:hypothetical protein